MQLERHGDELRLKSFAGNWYVCTISEITAIERFSTNQTKVRTARTPAGLRFPIPVQHIIAAIAGTKFQSESAPTRF